MATKVNKAENNVKKKDLNVSYHKITIIDSAGEKIETCSTYGKEGAEIKLDSCPKNHPAWNKGSKNTINKGDAKVAKHIAKYASFQGKMFTSK